MIFMLDEALLKSNDCTTDFAFLKAYDTESSQEVKISAPLPVIRIVAAWVELSSDVLHLKLHWT